MTLIMFSFHCHCVREVLAQLCMLLLDCIVLLYYFVHSPIVVDYNASQFNNTTNTGLKLTINLNEMKRLKRLNYVF